MAINSNVLAENQATVLANDGSVMYATIQMRHGKESEMDKSKFVPAEIGVATDTKKAFMAFASNQVKEIMFREDSEIEELLGEVRKISDQAVQAVQTAETAAKDAIEDYTNQMKDTIPEDYTEMMKKVKILERTKAPAIYQTVTGNPITLTDAGEGTPVVDFAMNGKTEQVQTTGAQLLDVDQYYSDFKQDDGTYYATNQDFNNIRIPVTSDMIGKEYTFSADVEIEPGGSLSYLVIIANISETNIHGDRTTDKAQLKVSGTIETENDYFAISHGAGSSNIKVKNIMLNSGSEALPYEPYTGGQPSPSPEYPQEIVNAGRYNEETQKWEYEVTVQGKNLIPFPYMDGSSKTQNGITFAVQEDGGVKVNGTATRTTYFNFCEIDFGDITMTKGAPTNGKYVVSGSIENVEVRYDSGNNRTFAMVTNGTTVNNQIIYPQVEYGTEPIPYEKYRSQTVLLQSDRPLTKWDRLEKRDGQLGWAYKSGTKRLTGDKTEPFKIYNNLAASQDNVGFILTISDMLPNARMDGYCNNFIPINTPAVTYPSEGVTFGANNRDFYVIMLKSRGITDVESFNTWLKAHNMTIWYPTDEETFVPLTESEQSALEALTTYFPTTIISNDADCEMEIEYVADTKTYIDNKFAELAQNLAATQNTLLEV